MKYFIISENDIIGSKDFPIINQQVTDYILYKAMAQNKTFSETLNDYLIEKMNEDTEIYLKYVDDVMK